MGTAAVGILYSRLCETNGVAHFGNISTTVTLFYSKIMFYAKIMLVFHT